MRQILGAALDVLEEEPPNPDNPLLTLDNVLFTPHLPASPMILGRATVNSFLPTCKRDQPPVAAGDHLVVVQK